MKKASVLFITLASFLSKINIHNENINIHNIFRHKKPSYDIIIKILGGENCEEIH